MVGPADPKGERAVADRLQLLQGGRVGLYYLLIVLDD
jgi:hypothetical protein